VKRELVRFGQKFIAVLYSADAIAVRRLTIAESRHSDIGKLSFVKPTITELQCESPGQSSTQFAKRGALAQIGIPETSIDIGVFRAPRQGSCQVSKVYPGPPEFVPGKSSKVSALRGAIKQKSAGQIAAAIPTNSYCHMTKSSPPHLVRERVSAPRLLHEPVPRNNAAMTYHGTFRPR
jgi:hypothetical protein